MTGLDFESTGTNVFEDRAVTAALVGTAPGTRPRTMSWVIDPGIDIPAEAAAVHGWTREAVLERVGGEGRAVRITTRERDVQMTAAEAIADIAQRVAQTIALEVPLVIANAAYDCSLLTNELVRHGGRAVEFGGVVDPMVLNSQWDPFRKSCYRKGPDGTPCDKENGVHVCGGCRGGKHACGGCGATDRKLSSLCAHYGVFLGAAHEAGADALAAVRLAARIGGLWRDAGRLKLSTLHAKQVEWRAQQMDGLRSWFDKNGTEHDGCCGEWPVHSSCAPAMAGVSA